MVPAKQLVGLTLEDTWNVTELLERPPGATGGCFSQSYRVVAADGRKAFLKALDYTEALTNSDDPARVLAALTTAYNYERDLLAKCKGRRMSRVVTILADGKVRVSDSIDGTVQYLIFEEAAHDARSRMGSGEQFDLALRLRALHHVATGIRQLHGLEIAHQDLKPSNVLMFDDCSKVGDLGCASQKGTAAPRDALTIPGDPAYAPPELPIVPCP
jgi:serine/threonine protein kinase